MWCGNTRNRGGLTVTWGPSLLNFRGNLRSLCHHMIVVGSMVPFLSLQVGRALGFRLLRVGRTGLMVREDSNFGDVSGIVSSFLGADSLGCYRGFLVCVWFWSPGLSGGAIHWLSGLYDVTIHAIYCDGYVLGLILIGSCWARPGCGCLCSCSMCFCGLHGGSTVWILVAERSGLLEFLLPSDLLLLLHHCYDITSFYFIGWGDMAHN